MKLVFLITGLNIGGAEIMLLNLLERLDRRYEPHVISLTDVGAIGPRIQALGVPVEALGMSARWPNPLAFFRLVARLKALQPTIVHSWMYHADLMGGVAARVAGCGAIGWGIRNSNLGGVSTPVSTHLVVRACAWTSHWVPHRILCCSEIARQFHVSIGYARDKMVVVPNGFDLVRFRPDGAARVAFRRELGVPSGAFLVGLVGRFDPQKSHAGFIQAAVDVHRRVPGVQFVLAGKGVDGHNPALAELVAQSGLGHVTHLLGPRNDIPRLMAAIDVLVSASAYGEAFPNVLGEAMACGIPCVATDVGDSATIVGDTGRVVPAGDMAALAAAIRALLHMPADERHTLGQRARARVAQHFEIGQVVRQYQAFYDALAATATCNGRAA